MKKLFLTILAVFAAMYVCSATAALADPTGPKHAVHSATWMFALGVVVIGFIVLAGIFVYLWFYEDHSSDADDVSQLTSRPSEEKRLRRRPRTVQASRRVRAAVPGAARRS